MMNADDEPKSAREATLAMMQRVADWQIANPSKRETTDWTQGALYAGMMALGDICPDSKYRDAMMAIGKMNQWQAGKRVYHADDHAVGQMYCEMYSIHRDPGMLAPLRARLDYILANPAKGAVDARVEAEGIPAGIMRWWWCDALFMGPPAWTRLYAATGEEEYLDFMIREWWATFDFLFDKEEDLFFRDKTFFEKKESNGKKVFWSRGNGWVMGGLVRVLQDIPSDHPERMRFVEQYQQMAGKLITCQQADGLWRSSLLDPDSYPIPETSGSGFFCYAMAWGINQGLLDRAKFEPAVRKAWGGLTGCVADDGKLTHVQPIGANPKEFATDSTEAYGVGAFLLAGSEIYRMQLMLEAPHATIGVLNSMDLFRAQETIEISMAALRAMLPEAAAKNIAVMDSGAARWITSQVLDENGGGMPAKLLFQSDLLPRQKKSFVVFSGIDRENLPAPVLRTTARFVPERADDFAWENDRIAFRMYGPALFEQDGPAGTGSGVDVWCKHVREPIVDGMYKRGNYHIDDGRGVDCYKVCPGRGCGGVAVWDQNRLWASSDFDTWKVISAGPIRAMFELTYAEWATAGRKVSEMKRISLDLGSNFNRFESVFTADGAGDLTIAVGLNTQKVGKVDGGDGWVAVWLPGDGKNNGMVGTAVILPEGGGYKQLGDQVVLLALVKPGEPLVHYAGACWDKGLDFKDSESWNRHVREFAARLRAPPEVETLKRAHRCTP